MPAGLHLPMSGLVMSFVRSSLGGSVRVQADGAVRLKPDTTIGIRSVPLQADGNAVRASLAVDAGGSTWRPGFDSRTRACSGSGSLSRLFVSALTRFQGSAVPRFHVRNSNANN